MATYSAKHEVFAEIIKLIKSRITHDVSLEKIYKAWKEIPTEYSHFIEKDLHCNEYLYLYLLILAEQKDKNNDHDFNKFGNNLLFPYWISNCKSFWRIMQGYRCKITNHELVRLYLEARDDMGRSKFENQRNFVEFLIAKNYIYKKCEPYIFPICHTLKGEGWCGCYQCCICLKNNPRGEEFGRYPYTFYKGLCECKFSETKKYKIKNYNYESDKENSDEENSDKEDSDKEDSDEENSDEENNWDDDDRFRLRKCILKTTLKELCCFGEEIDENDQLNSKYYFHECSCYNNYFFIIRRERAATKIQKWWKNKMYHPDSSYVQSVLKTRFESFQM